AERAMYFDTDVAGLTADGAHAVVGAGEPRNDWSFAEGSTQNGFREFLTLANPGDGPATATVAFGIEGGERKSTSVTVPAGQRVTVNVADVIGPVVGHSTRVTSDRRILAARPMYFDAQVSGLV